MNLQDLANLGELLGGIGVMVTLVYLAVQIRQNTTAQRNDSRFNTTRAMTQWYITIMTDETLVDIFNRGFLDPPSLTASERGRFMWMLAALCSRIEEIHAQYEAGLIPAETWERYRDFVASMIQTDAAGEWWQSGVTPLGTGFRKAVESTPAASATWDPAKLEVLNASLRNPESDEPPVP